MSTKHVPGQTVERVLDMRERRVVIDGAYMHFSRDGAGAKDQKGPTKLSRICKYLDEDELSDQEIGIEYRHQQDEIAYGDALAAYDANKHQGELPRRPRLTVAIARGEARTFVLPNGIDSAIRDVLKEIKEWPRHLIKFVDSTKRAFGVADTDADFLLPDEKAEAAPENAKS
jgi:hypothetical protein